MDEIPVVILCGGQGTRMRGGTLTKKELVEIGGRAIIWHVMRIYSAFGHNRFVLALGYGAEQIKRYFLTYEAMSRDLTLQLGGPIYRDPAMATQYHGSADHSRWQVTLADTGLNTEKASRLLRLADYLDGDRFFLTYGDGVGNIDLDALLAFHRQHGRLATITSVQVPFQYGILEAGEDDQVCAYHQKPMLPHWINAGFMVFERQVLSLIDNDSDVHLERHILPQLVADGQLMRYRHPGFWRSMDTLKDTMMLEEMWEKSAPWKVW
ncbi:MAG: sugar phosphate nucleotidyltransferase [Anaerolineae bacterium]|nr:sugar phosphate nucleotidyltransferase [Anaerolineae bacterium]